MGKININVKNNLGGSSGQASGVISILVMGLKKKIGGEGGGGRGHKRWGDAPECIPAWYRGGSFLQMVMPLQSPKWPFIRFASMYI